MIELPQASLDRAIAIMRDIEFPTLPLYLQMIQKEVRQLEPSFAKIGHYVSQDIALTAKVLKVVNSPAYATRYPIDNIPQALTTLGLTNFVSAILEEALKNELDQQHLSPQNFAIIWRHSSDVAMAAKFIAERLNTYKEFALTIDSNHAYLAGLFHDCGIPIMAARFSEYENIVTEAFVQNTPLIEAESSNFYTDHSVVSYLVGKSWELPKTVTNVLFCHHSKDLGYYKEAEEGQLSLVLRLAESFLADIAFAKGAKPHPFTANPATIEQLLPLLENELAIHESIVEELYLDLEMEILTP